VCLTVVGRLSVGLCGTHPCCGQEVPSTITQVGGVACVCGHGESLSELIECRLDLCSHTEIDDVFTWVDGATSEDSVRWTRGRVRVWETLRGTCVWSACLTRYVSSHRSVAQGTYN
jgi:hypothetical protein